MNTKQKLFDDLQEIKTGLDSLIQLISDFDQVELEDELCNCIESIIGKISHLISFSEDLLNRKQGGMNIEELRELLKEESKRVFLHLG